MSNEIEILEPQCFHRIFCEDKSSIPHGGVIYDQLLVQAVEQRAKTAAALIFYSTLQHQTCSTSPLTTKTAGARICLLYSHDQAHISCVSVQKRDPDNKITENEMESTQYCERNCSRGRGKSTGAKEMFSS
jgi:hypothetical protein